MPFEDTNFIPHYQRELFADCNDNFKICESKRKLMSMVHCAALSSTSLDTTSVLLENNLNEYTKIVDEKKGDDAVNNYAKYCLSLASNCTDKPDVKLWKSNAGSFDLDITGLFPCNEHEYSCKNSEMTDSDLKLLFHAKNGKSIRDKNDERSVTNSTKTYSSSSHFQTKSTVNSPIAGPSVQQSTKQTLLNTSAKVHHTKVYTNNKLISEEDFSDAKPKSSYFRTASDELSIQNFKKFGSRDNPKNQYFNYGSSKKSLGGRRSVGNKFVPPVRPENEGIKQQGISWSDDAPLESEEPICDERLRHIDPKMVELIRSEIMDNGAAVGWDDIAGLEFAKSSIQESVVWPLLRPDIFTGLRRPPKGILLFGPPGTGKTLIGKCIASQSGSTFFSISASSLTSKWVGDGEKMVRALFAVASVHQPAVRAHIPPHHLYLIEEAVVFIDEIDSLLSQRSESEHESSRRIKTEFLVQLDGAGTGDEDRILIIGATNRPQELDEAARRRLVKRLYIALPEQTARKQIVGRLMQTEQHSLTTEEMEEIAKMSVGYSGSDMKNLCQEASLGPIRNIDIRKIQEIRPDQVRPINFDDFHAALSRVRASVSSRDLDLYVEWNKLYGSG